MDTAESMSTVDAEEEGTASPFPAQGWLERRCISSRGTGDWWLLSSGFYTTLRRSRRISKRRHHRSGAGDERSRADETLAVL